MNYIQYINLLIKLLILINPIGLIPIYLSCIDKINKNERKKFNIYINLIMFFILIIMFLLGNKFLNFFDLNINVLQITGGLLISLSSFNIINDYSDIKEKSSSQKKINFIKLLTPISFPLMAGPSSITMLISYGSNYCNNFLEYFFSIFFIAVFSFFCWFFFELILILRNYISDFIVIFLNKIFSIILLTYGIQIILLNIKKFI